MFILEATKALDFSPASTTNFSPIIVGCVFFGLCTLLGIIGAIIEDDGIYAFGGFLLGLLIGAFFTLIGLAVTSGREESPDQTAALQSWVSDTYLIDLTDQQASDIIDNQINVKDSAEENADNVAITVKNAYDDLVSVTLVKDGKNYVLVQSGSEIPAATLGNK